VTKLNTSISFVNGIIEQINYLTNQNYGDLIDCEAPMIYMEGKCYFFARILLKIYGLDEKESLMINKTKSHVAVKIDGKIYDACGLVENPNDFKLVDSADFITIDLLLSGDKSERRFNDEIVNTIVNLINNDYLKEGNYTYA
jgi:hypothetical protein